MRTIYKDNQSFLDRRSSHIHRAVNELICIYLSCARDAEERRKRLSRRNISAQCEVGEFLDRTIKISVFGVFIIMNERWLAVRMSTV